MLPVFSGIRPTYRPSCKHNFFLRAQRVPLSGAHDIHTSSLFPIKNYPLRQRILVEFQPSLLNRDPPITSLTTIPNSEIRILRRWPLRKPVKTPTLDPRYFLEACFPERCCEIFRQREIEILKGDVERAPSSRIGEG